MVVLEVLVVVARIASAVASLQSSSVVRGAPSEDGQTDVDGSSGPALWPRGPRAPERGMQPRRGPRGVFGLWHRRRCVGRHRRAGHPAQLDRRVAHGMHVTLDACVRLCLCLCLCPASLCAWIAK